MTKKFYESVRRSLVEAITRRLDVTIGVMFLSNFASTLLYVVHERVWNNIHWGKYHRR